MSRDSSDPGVKTNYKNYCKILSEDIITAKKKKKGTIQIF
jgi:hypothetical protein